MTSALGPTTWFFVSLLATVLLLGGAVLAGRAGRRPVHLGLVALTVPSLGLTVFAAKRLGAAYLLAEAGPIYPLHLWLARLAVASLLPAVVLGVWTVGSSQRRSLHGRLALAALAFTVISAISGAVLLALAPAAQIAAQ